MSGPNASWDEGQEGLPFLNTSGEIVPPFACMELVYTGSDATDMDGDDLYFKIKKPTSVAVDDPSRVIFNGPEAVAIDGFGVFVPNSFACVLLDSTSGTPSPGESLGAKDGSWGLEAGSGFSMKSEDGSDAYSSGVLESIWVQREGGGNKLYRFTLNEAWSSNAADADILLMDGTDTGTDADVLDPLGIFADLGSGDAGLCLLQGGVYYVIQAACPA